MLEDETMSVSTEVTDFEASIASLLIKGYTSGVMTEKIAKDDAKKLAPELLSIAKDQFVDEVAEWIGSHLLSASTGDYYLKEFRDTFSSKSKKTKGNE